MGRDGRKARGRAGFYPALRCLIRQWRALELWIIAEVVEAPRSRFQLAPLRNVVSQRREAIIASGSLRDWTPITIHLTGEVSARDRTMPYSGSMFAARPGDIVFSKIDARHGAVTVLPPEIPKAVVTSEYPVFIPNSDRLHGEFVKLVLRTGGFLAALHSRASGTSGRKRITPEAFLDLCVPLPPLDEQRAIVTAYGTAQDRAIRLEREADEIAERAKEVFETTLGFGPPAPLPECLAFVASFRDVDRWSHEGILRRTVEAHTVRTSPYPTVRLRDVIADLQNGWSPKCHARPVEPNEWGVLKVSAASSGNYRETENKALPTELTPKKALEIRTGDVLITRASGVARLVGVAAFVDSTRHRLMLCDKIFRIVNPNDAKVDSRFIAYVFGIHHVRAQIEREFSTKSGMMKNISKPALMDLTFPLPPKPEQVAMVKSLTDARVQAATLHQQARRARAKAWAEFEAAVYMEEGDVGAAAS